MTSSEIFEGGTFCGDKDIVEWKTRSRGVVKKVKSYQSQKVKTANLGDVCE